MTVEVDIDAVPSHFEQLTEIVAFGDTVLVLRSGKPILRIEPVHEKREITPGFAKDIFGNSNMLAWEEIDAEFNRLFKLNLDEFPGSDGLSKA